jgi:hypothetical protein
MQTLKTRWAPYLVGVIGTLLFVDLFLGWHRAGVSVSGIVDVHSDSSAWAGWGALAGVLLIVLLFWEGLRLRGAVIAQEMSGVIVSLTLALGVAAFTTIEFFAGTTDVQAGSLVTVGVHGRQWPAYVGLVLAVLLVLATIVQLGRPVERHSGRLGLGVR